MLSNRQQNLRRNRQLPPAEQHDVVQFNFSLTHISMGRQVHPWWIQRHLGISETAANKDPIGWLPSCVRPLGGQALSTIDPITS